MPLTTATLLAQCFINDTTTTKTVQTRLAPRTRRLGETTTVTTTTSSFTGIQVHLRVSPISIRTWTPMTRNRIRDCDWGRWLCVVTVVDRTVLRIRWQSHWTFTHWLPVAMGSELVDASECAGPLCNGYRWQSKRWSLKFSSCSLSDSG